MPKSLPTLQPHGLRELRAYQLSKELAQIVYQITSGFPKSEYRLVGQIRGAAVSVFGNIKEEPDNYDF